MLGTAIVVMGVSGAGKSTIGQMLAEAIDCTFLDADDIHSQYNKDKMQRGIPLTEEDRIPWLNALRELLCKSLENGRAVILGCSALKTHYREVLRSADPSYKPRNYSSSKVKFVLLDASEEVLAARLQKRLAEGKHFMPVMLLQSQLDSLQIDDTEGILKVDATTNPLDTIHTIQASNILEQANVCS